MNTTFDTLTAAHSLEDAGIEPKQAEAIVAAIRSSRSEVITQGDLAAAVAELQASSKMRSPSSRGTLRFSGSRSLPSVPSSLAC